VRNGDSQRGGSTTSAEIAEFTLIGAFLLGLAHTLEPCEDKAVVSLLTLWGSERWLQGILVVVLYGLTMTFVNTSLVVIFCLAGADLIQAIQIYLTIGASVIMIIIGIFMIWGKHLLSLGHFLHRNTKEKETGKKEEAGLIQKKSAGWVFLMGVARGIPYCPVEVAVVLWAVSIGSVLAGASIMFVFGIATTIGLIPIGIIMGSIAQKATATKYKRYIPLIAGLVFILFGIVTLLLRLI